MSRPADLRDWIARIESLGELQHVSGAHWDQEIGAISEINYRRKPSAALLFDDIVGYPRGYRVLTGTLSNARRMAVTLGLDPGLDTVGLVQALRGKPMEWEQHARQMEPEVVERGPILENVVKTPDIDLTKFPAPLWHEHDGGRYIGTGVAVVTSDPDTGRINLGAYRAMFKGQPFYENAMAELERFVSETDRLLEWLKKLRDEGKIRFSQPDRMTL